MWGKNADTSGTAILSNFIILLIDNGTVHNIRLRLTTILYKAKRIRLIGKIYMKEAASRYTNQ